MINKEKINEYYTASLARFYRTNDKEKLENFIKKDKIHHRNIRTKDGEFFTIFKKNKIISQINILYFYKTEKNENTTSTDNV